nr:hypothetical protein CFP56_50100 [Quercus suber]
MLKKPTKSNTIRPFQCLKPKSNRERERRRRAAAAKSRVTTSCDCHLPRQLPIERDNVVLLSRVDNLLLGIPFLITMPLICCLQELQELQPSNTKNIQSRIIQTTCLDLKVHWNQAQKSPEASTNHKLVKLNGSKPLKPRRTSTTNLQVRRTFKEESSKSYS